MGQCQLQVRCLLLHSLTWVMPPVLDTLMALSSAANHLVTVYDVNYASSGHMEMHGVPFMLPGSSNLELPVAGSLIFQPSGTNSTDYLHFQLSSRGSLWKTNISFSSEVEQASDNVSLNDYEWTDEMHALANKSKAMAEDVGNLGERDCFIANLSGIYESECFSRWKELVTYSCS